MNEGYVKVARLVDLIEGRGKKVVVEDEEIALWRVNGRVHAICNVCAHQHISALHQATLDGLFVTCPMHGWTYSLETGEAVTGQGRVRRFDVVIQGGDVYIENPGAVR